MDRKPSVRKIIKPPIQDKSERKEQNLIRRAWAKFVVVAGILAVIAGIIANSSTIVNWVGDTYHHIFPILPTAIPTEVLPKVGTTFCIYQEHKGTVNTVAWSPNGQFIASAGKDGTVRVWNALTCRDVTIYRGHKGPVNSISWSPDSKRIVSGGDDTTIQVWLADTGSHLYTYSGSGCSEVSCGECGFLPTTFKQVSSVAWSPDGNYIAFGSLNGHIRVFDADNGECTFALDNQWAVNSVLWSADSKHIVFGGNTPNLGANATIQIWNINSNSIVSSLQFCCAIYDMGISPDGKFIIATITGEGLDFIKMWNIIKGNFTPSTSMTYFSQEDYWGSIAWACDSKHAIIGAEFGRVEVFDTTKGHIIYTYYTTPVTSVAVSPDGTRIASADDVGLVRVWQASNKRIC